MRYVSCATALLLALFGLAACTDEVGEDLNNDSNTPDSVFYTSDIQPLLEQNCTSCHNRQISNGGVRLHTYQDVLSNVEDSSLVYSIRYEGAGSISPMPPSGKLPQTVINEIERWVQQGAPE